MIFYVLSLFFIIFYLLFTKSLRHTLYTWEKTKRSKYKNAFSLNDLSAKNMGLAQDLHLVMADLSSKCMISQFHKNRYLNKTIRNEIENGIENFKLFLQPFTDM